MKYLTSTILAAGLAATALVAPSVALAEYPEKPVSFIVPWPPGDLEDVLTRMIAEDFQTEYGVAAAVVNKPGGGGGPFPGAIEVANAPADGYTIGSFIIAIPVVGPQIGIPELNPTVAAAVLSPVRLKSRMRLQMATPLGPSSLRSLLLARRSVFQS